MYRTSLSPLIPKVSPKSSSSCSTTLSSTIRLAQMLKSPLIPPTMLSLSPSRTTALASLPKICLTSSIVFIALTKPGLATSQATVWDWQSLSRSLPATAVRLRSEAAAIPGPNSPFTLPPLKLHLSSAIYHRDSRYEETSVTSRAIPEIPPSHQSFSITLHCLRLRSPHLYDLFWRRYLSRPLGRASPHPSSHLGTSPTVPSRLAALSRSAFCV